MAQPTCVAALLAEQEQQLLDEPADARQRDAVAPEDRRPRREVRPEQLVGRVDEVDLHRRLLRPQPAAEPVSTRRFMRSRSAWKIARRIGRLRRPRRGPAAPAASSRLRPAHDGRRAVRAGLEREHPVALEQAEVPDRVAARRIELDDLDGVDDRDAEDPHDRLGARPDRRRAPGCRSGRDFMSCIHSSWRGMSATTAQTASIGASTTASISSGGSGRVAAPGGQHAIGDPARRRSRARRGRRAGGVTPVSAAAWTGGARRPPRISAERPLAVAGLQVDRRDGVGEHGRRVAEPDGVERRRLDAVVGREAGRRRPRRRRPRAGAPSSSVGIVSPVVGSRIEKPE